MNQVILPAADLKQALSGLSKVVNRKASLPVLQHVRLTRTSAGNVTLQATDLDAFVSYNLTHAQPGEQLDVLLPFETLNKSGRGSGGEVVVQIESKDLVRLRYQVAGSSLEQSVAILQPDEFPPKPIINKPMIKLPENFGECLRQAFETSSDDSSRYVLQGAYLDVDEPNCHSIVSTNGRTLFAANTFKFDLKESVNLYRQKFLEWPGFLNGECEMSVKKEKDKVSWVQLTTPRWECIAKQIDGNYPNWRQVVPCDTDNWTKVQLSETALRQMLNLSAQLPGDDHANRTLHIKVDTELHLEGRNKDDAKSTSAVIADVKITGSPVVTALNREYLQTALRCGLNEIRINTEMDPLLFLKPGKRMVVMPVRLNGPATPTVPPADPSASVPPAAEEQPRAEEKESNKADMTKETVKSTPAKNAEPTLLDMIEQIKDAAKNLVRDLNTLTEGARQLEREKRVSEKEVEAARSVLKKLQQVQI